MRTLAARTAGVSRNDAKWLGSVPTRKTRAFAGLWQRIIPIGMTFKVTVDERRPFGVDP
jgi:hypothetical protein